MPLIPNNITVSSLDAPDVIVKVISWKSQKKITIISGLFTESKNSLPPYFSEDTHKKISSEFKKKCAAGAAIIVAGKEKIIQIQGEQTNIIEDYLVQLGIPKEKIKIFGIDY